MRRFNLSFLTENYQSTQTILKDSARLNKSTPKQDLIKA